MANFGRELRVGGRFKLGRKVGSGSFGDIYMGVDLENNREIAIKLEPRRHAHPQLAYEYKVYRILGTATGIPKVIWYGEEGDFNILVMELLGPSLEELFEYCGRKFSVPTTVVLIDQFTKLIQYIHSKSFLHRDIKPDNFLMGTGGNSNISHLVDFGLAKRYCNPRTRQHIPFSEHKSLTGTARYASVNAHLGVEQGRRDDLESIGYVAVYFLRGRLPWQGLQCRDKADRYNQISKLKSSIPIEELCKDLPPVFASYINYCKSLRFDDKPNYRYLRQRLHECYTSYKSDNKKKIVFDWRLVKESDVVSIPRTIKRYNQLLAEHVDKLRKNRDSDKK